MQIAAESQATRESMLSVAATACAERARQFIAGTRLNDDDKARSALDALGNALRAIPNATEAARMRNGVDAMISTQWDAGEVPLWGARALALDQMMPDVSADASASSYGNVSMASLISIANNGW